MTGTVRDLVLRTPIALLPDTPICEAEQHLISSQVQEIYVVNAEDHLLGMIPEVEFLNYRLLGGDGQGRIAALMGPVEFWLTSQASLQEAARYFQQPGRSSLAILEGERFIGQLYRMDLLRLLANGQSDFAMEEIPPTDSCPIPPPKFSYFKQTGELKHLRTR